MELVDEVKRQLDSEKPKPDGYNIGINVNKAAGQTVMHLHVHVIPRYEGDRPDPRGGVRHVIPEKGNYLADRRATYKVIPKPTAHPAPHREARLSTGAPDDPFFKAIRPHFAHATDITIVAAFVQDSGLELLK